MVDLHENCSQGVKLLQASSGSRTRERAEQTPDQQCLFVFGIGALGVGKIA
jgi:hypothetical protein